MTDKWYKLYESVIDQKLQEYTNLYGDIWPKERIKIEARKAATLYMTELTSPPKSQQCCCCKCRCCK